MKSDPDWMAAMEHHLGAVHETTDEPPRYFASAFHIGADLSLEIGPVRDTEEEAAKAWLIRNGMGDQGLLFRKPRG